MFQWKNTDYFVEAVKEEMSGKNSPRRTPEVARNVGSRETARWIGKDEPITLVSGINVDC
jgi:hypothetical protein